MDQGIKAVVSEGKRGNQTIWEIRIGSGNCFMENMYAPNAELCARAMERGWKAATIERVQFRDNALWMGGLKIGKVWLFDARDDTWIWQLGLDVQGDAKGSRGAEAALRRACRLWLKDESFA